MAEQLDDEALNIYTDGSMLSHPRRGGVGFRFVTVDEHGEEVCHDSDLPGRPQATNNQMEIQAAIEALNEVVARWSPVDPARFKKVAIYTDSEYFVDGYRRALFGWGDWQTASGRPVANADLWDQLTRAAFRTGKRVEFNWIPGKKGRHAKAVDKLAKASARNAIGKPVRPSRIRRSRSERSVSIGSVGMDGQEMTIYVRKDEWMPVQRCYVYRYEVASEDSPYHDSVDDIYSDRSIVLSAGHTYRVRVNTDPGNPRVLELLEEVE